MRKLAKYLFVAGVLACAYQFATPSADHVPALFVCTGSHGHGSAVSLGGGLFLTAKHVTDNEEVVNICIDGKTYDGKLQRDFPGYDLALIRTEQLRDKPATPIRCEDELAIGTPVFAEGYPWDLGYMRMSGYVAQPIRWDETMQLESGFFGSIKVPYRALQWLDLRAAPGMSGGPVLDEKNRLVGITVLVQDTLATKMVPAKAVCEALALPVTTTVTATSITQITIHPPAAPQAAPPKKKAQPK